MATAVVSVGLALFGAGEQRKARKSQRKAEKIQSKQAAAQNAKARRQQILQGRRARASAVAQGEAQGISGGSAVQGTVGAVQTQTASNVSFLGQLASFDRARFGALSGARTAQGRAATFQTFSNLADSPTGTTIGKKVGSFFNAGG